MIALAQVINEKEHLVNVGLEKNEEAVAFYKSLGMTEMDVEKCEWNGNWYLTGHVPEKPATTIQEQILELESQVTARNLRAALQGDEYALNKIKEIEAQIEELRKQLPDEDIK